MSMCRNGIYVDKIKHQGGQFREDESIAQLSAISDSRSTGCDTDPRACGGGICLR